MNGVGDPAVAALGAVAEGEGEVEGRVVLDAALPGIEDDVLDDFEALLESADADLLAWFMGASRPFEPGWQKLVDMVVDHSRAHLSAV